MSGYDDMARHVRDALEESEIHGDGSCTITPEYYLILNADFEAWDEADDAKLVSEERRDEVINLLRQARWYVADSLEAHEHSDGRDLLTRIDAALTPVPGER